MSENGFHGAHHEMLVQIYGRFVMYFVGVARCVRAVQEIDEIYIESDGLNTFNYICTSLRSAHFAIVSKILRLDSILGTAYQTIVTVVKGLCKMRAHRLWRFYVVASYCDVRLCSHWNDLCWIYISSTSTYTTMKT